MAAPSSVSFSLLLLLVLSLCASVACSGTEGVEMRQRSRGSAGRQSQKKKNHGAGSWLGASTAISHFLSHLHSHTGGVELASIYSYMCSIYPSLLMPCLEALKRTAISFFQQIVGGACSAPVYPPTHLSPSPSHLGLARKEIYLICSNLTVVSFPRRLFVLAASTCAEKTCDDLAGYNANDPCQCKPLLDPSGARHHGGRPA